MPVFYLIPSKFAVSDFAKVRKFTGTKVQAKKAADAYEKELNPGSFPGCGLTFHEAIICATAKQFPDGIAMVYPMPEASAKIMPGFAEWSCNQSDAKTL